MTASPSPLRIGIDVGGTKIEGAAFDGISREVKRLRIPTPRGDYDASIRAIADMTASLAYGTSDFTVGVGIPGSISTATGFIQNANSTWLNGRDFARDLEAALGHRPVRMANDANCFALSEATDGAGAGARIVLGVILGTGCGSGIVVDGQILDGPNRTGGEWGHNPLPWPREGEWPGSECWCGRKGCMETWVSGPALASDHVRETGIPLRPEEIVEAANAGDAAARNTLARHADRLARGLSHVVNIVDPDVIVLGGGLSDLPHLYDSLPDLMCRHIFSDAPKATIRAPRWVRRVAFGVPLGCGITA